jgi:hypothetical protein
VINVRMEITRNVQVERGAIVTIGSQDERWTVNVYDPHWTLYNMPYGCFMLGCLGKGQV